MSEPVQPTRVSQMLKSAQARAQAHLQHWGLRLIELTPAPRKFALRNALFTHLSFLFQGTPSFAVWQKAFDYFITQRQTQIELIDLAALPIPQQLPMKKIALHAHLFYTDLANPLAELIKSLPTPIDLFISTPHQADLETIEHLFKPLPTVKRLVIELTPNRGRDLAPMICTFGRELASYDYFAHIHTKKSFAANPIGDAWREYLWSQLLGSAHHRIEKILALLSSDALVYPQKFAPIDVINCQWGPNWEAAKRLCQQWQITAPPKGFVEFPVGTMFWAQSKALSPLLLSGLEYADFEEELGQTEGTLAHALERSITHLCTAQGLEVAILTSHFFFNPYP